MPNITQWASSGLYAVQVAQRGSTGYMAGFSGLALTDTGESGNMRLLVGGVTAPSPLPQSTRVRNRGRDSYIAERIFDSPPNDFNIVFEDFDGDVSVMLNELTLLTVGEWDFVPEGGPTEFQDSMWLFTRHATSKESSSDGTEGFENLLIMSSSGRIEPGNMDFQAPGSFTAVATASPVQKTHFGLTATASYGQQSIYTTRWFSEHPCSMAVLIGDGTETDITLGFTPISTAKTRAADFTSGTMLTVSAVDTGADTATLSAAPTSGHAVVCVYETNDI